MYENYYSFMEPIRYTPQEIYSRQSNNERLQTQAAIGNQGMQLGLNVAQNLSPSAGLGFLLGNLGGRALNNYLARNDAKKIAAAEEAAKIKNMSQGLGQWARTSLIPQAWQNQQPQFRLGKYPANGQYFQPPVPNVPNQYTFQPAQLTPNNPYNPALLNFNRTW